MKLGAIILATDSSSRMQRSHPLLEIQNKTMLARCIELVQQAERLLALWEKSEGLGR